MIRLFYRYISVGVINTIIHWVSFYIMLYFFSFSQASSNLISFMIAVSFSFFANAKFTFKAKPTTIRYTIFVTFTGIISFICGSISDYYRIYPLITLTVFSGISLILGFIFSKYVIFKEGK
ncbi:translocase [Pectobacterium brasiliense]|uniref:GtrA family protein n=1 Tax=Pectobacterium brasiliense TaxID=180957 RepID=UPI0004E73B99|nr:GtrA family protein [Pectobacterium brasiliense]KFF67797.1 translocase [Pectobacterium brasiliense]